MSFLIYSCKTGKYWNHNVFTNLQILTPTFWLLSLTCFLPGKNSPSIAKSNRVFLERGEGIEPWFWHIWIAQWLKFYPPYCLSFSIAAIFRSKQLVKVGPKVQTFGPSLFHENLKLSNFFQAMFLFVRVLPLVRISAILDHIWRRKGPKPPKKGHFMDSESVWKTLQTFNLTTANAILMKLFTIIYLHGSVNRKTLKARNSAFWRNV